MHSYDGWPGVDQAPPRAYMAAMATLHIICGMPGSGKTTLADRLEVEANALRLSADEWMARIVGEGWDDAKRERIHEVQYDVTARVLALGVSVVLEAGFWGKSERDHMRAIAKAAGAGFRLYFLDVPLEELKRRLAVRNAALPLYSFPVEPEWLDDWIKEFQPPTAEELKEQWD